MTSNETHKTIYKVILDHNNKYLIVPIDSIAPASSSETGKTGLIEECEDYVFHHVNENSTISTPPPNQKTASQIHKNRIVEEIPFTPIQYKFFSNEPPEPHHWNITKLFKLKQGMSSELLRQAVYHVINNHDALRLRFKKINAEWHQFLISVVEEGAFTQIDILNSSEQEELPALKAVAAEQQTSLSLADGPVIRFFFFNFGIQKPPFLLLIVNHLVCDAYSVGILLEDLIVAYNHLETGNLVQLPFQTTSFKDWVQRQLEYAQSEESRKEIEYWLSHLQTQFGQLPVDKLGGILTESTAHAVTISLTEKETYTLLKKVLFPKEATITDALMTALVSALAYWTGTYSWVIELVGHGRITIFDDIDLSRTIGWLVTHTPVFITLEAKSDIDSNLQSVKYQIRRIPNYGFGYDILSCHAKDLEITNEIKQLPQSKIIFNFFGRASGNAFNNAFTPVQADIGPIGLHKNIPKHLLIFNGIILDNTLELMLTYSTEIHYESTIVNLLQYIKNSLSEIINLDA